MTPSSCLLYRSPNLPAKIELWAFLCFNLEFIPFSPKIWIFFIHSLVSGAFLHVFHNWQTLFRHFNHFDGLYLVFKSCSVEQGWKFFSFIFPFLSWLQIWFKLQNMLNFPWILCKNLCFSFPCLFLQITNVQRSPFLWLSEIKFLK